MDVLAAYSKQRADEQNDLIITHAPLVKRIARHLMLRLPNTVQIDDLYQAGMLGLLEASRNYDATKGAAFETYAGIRIRGHMLDEVRRNDWVPRSVYRNSRMISEAVRQVENRLGRDARDKEIAQELELSLEEYYDLLKDANGSQLYGFEDLGVSDDLLSSEEGFISQPQENALNDDFSAHLAQVIDTLPHKEKMVLSLYYEQDLNLKEIGEVLGVSESRVSQIHTQATLRIKARLTGTE